MEPFDLNYEYIHIYLLCIRIENFDIMIFIMMIMGRVELGGNVYSTTW